MATWNPPTDLEIAVTKPVKASNHRRIRDLVTALAEAAAGAPQINMAAIDPIAASGTTNVAGSVTVSRSDVVFNTSLVDTDTILNTSTGVMTVPQSGIYEFCFHVSCDIGVTSSGNLELYVVKNSSDYYSSVVPKGTSAGDTKNITLSGCILVSMAANDTLKIQLRTSVGTASLSGTRSFSLKSVGL